MKLNILKTTNYERDFIYVYLPFFIKSQILSSYNSKKVEIFEKELNINMYDMLEFALNNLKVSETLSMYSISINKNLFFRNYKVLNLINILTYGTRLIKGYPIVINVFNFIANHITDIYSDWRGDLYGC